MTTLERRGRGGVHMQKELADSGVVGDSPPDGGEAT